MDSGYNSTSQAKNEKSDPPPPPPIEPHSKPILPDPKKKESDGDKESSIKPSPPTRAVEWWQLGANCVLAAIGILVLCVYSGQLDVMRGQLKSMEGQLEQMKGAGAQTDQLISKTSEQAVATNELAKQSKRSDETLRLRDRAYVYFGDPVFVPYPPENVTVWGGNIFVYNSGNMPARRVVVKYSCPQLNTIEDPFGHGDWTTVEMPKVIGAQQNIGLQICQIHINKIMEAKKGDRHIFVVMEVDYTDGFGVVPRVTQMARIFKFDISGRHSFGIAGPHNCSDQDCQPN